MELPKDYIIDENFPCFGNGYHLATIVGYEKDDVFILRLSFGPNFGDNGYIRIRSSGLKNGSGTCGIF